MHHARRGPIPATSFIWRISRIIFEHFCSLTREMRPVSMPYEDRQVIFLIDVYN